MVVAAVRGPAYDHLSDMSGFGDKRVLRGLVGHIGAPGSVRGEMMTETNNKKTAKPSKAKKQPIKSSRQAKDTKKEPTRKPEGA